MSQYFGDLASSAALNFKFTTVGTDGAPTQLAGSPQLQIYKSNSTTQTTTGLTLTADFDSVTGLNHVLVNTASSGAFYSTGTDYTVIVSSGTVGGTSIAGYEVGHFSIANRSVNSLAANVVTATAIATDAITAAKIAANAITSSELADNTITANKIASSAITAAKIATDAITAAKIAADAIGSSELATTAVNEIRDAIISDATAFAGADIAAILADTADMQPKFGTFTDLGGGANIANNLNDLAGTTFSSTTDSNEAIRNHIGDGTNLTEAGGTGDQLSAIPWNAAWDAEVQSEVEDGITAQEPLSANVTQISGDSTAADRLEGLMDGVIIAQVNDASATTTAFAADGFTEATDDHFNGRLITFISGALAGQQTDITDYDAAGHAQGNQTFVVTALTEAPANNDFFMIH